MIQLLGIFLTLVGSAEAVPGKAQFTIRFGETRAHSSALTGCYGTASYQYILPDVDTLRAYRESVAEAADEIGLRGFAWSVQVHPQDQSLAYGVDLETGKVVLKAKFGHGDRGVVICLCRKSDLRNCTPSGLPPLGRPFQGGPITIDPLPVP